MSKMKSSQVTMSKFAAQNRFATSYHLYIFSTNKHEMATKTIEVDGNRPWRAVQDTLEKHTGERYLDIY